jgi:hypothetical protein
VIQGRTGSQAASFRFGINCSEGEHRLCWTHSRLVEEGGATASMWHASGLRSTMPAPPLQPTSISLGETVGEGLCESDTTQTSSQPFRER